MTIRMLRRGVQTLSLLLFIWLLIKTTWPLQPPLSPQLYLRADPLAVLAVALYRPTWQLVGYFAPALAVLAATMLLGRFFCGWLCPLGACIDASDHLLRARKRRRWQQPRLKFAVLAAVLVSAIFGAQLFWVLDPIPLLTRTFATVIDPAARDVYNVAVQHLASPLREWGLRLRPVADRPFALGIVSGGMFVLILLGGLLGQRTWCRNLCPLGALLGFTGRWGLWRRRVDESCNSCRLCVGACKMDAIPPDAPAQTRHADCIQCYNCLGPCRRGASSLSLGMIPIDTTIDTGRRHFLAASLLGLGYGGLTVAGLIPRFIRNRVIRPPGAIVRHPDGSLKGLMTEEEFRGKCLRCGQCMKACITGGLQPAVTEAGVDGFYTPVLKPQVGWCEQTCLACGLVCPSGALIPFNAEEKKRIQIGLALIDRETCLGWGKGDKYRECLVCDEHCSYKAIELRDEEGGKRPHVVEDKCTGCGICEKACPVKPARAIVVYGPPA